MYIDNRCKILPITHRKGVDEKMSEFPTKRPVTKQTETKSAQTFYPRFTERIFIGGILFALCFSAGKISLFESRTNQLKTIIHTNANPQTIRKKTEEAVHYCKTWFRSASLEVGAQLPEDSTRQYEITIPSPTPEETQPAASQTVFSVPLQGIITSKFGDRDDPFDTSEAWHTGLDIAADTGTPICAAADGEIIHAGELGGYGYAVKICHPDGLVSLYGHCSEIFVTEGQQVQTGDEIAAVGSTGRSTGPHLHFEIIDGETYLNPSDFLSFV